MQTCNLPAHLFSNLFFRLRASEGGIEWRMPAYSAPEVVIKTNDFAGDGTTTASVLPCKIISLGCIVPPLNPVSIKKGIKNAQGLAKSLIRNLTCQLSRDVGISKPKPLPLSAGNDKFAGDMITDIINKVGLDLDGVFAIESSTLLEPSIHELGSYLCLFALIYRIE